MRYQNTIYVDPDELDKMEEILAIESGFCREFDADEVIAIYSIEFGNEFEADLEIINGDPPYLSGTLYQPVEEEEEIVLYEVDGKRLPKKLEGAHRFEHGGHVYEAQVKRSYFEEPGF